MPTRCITSHAMTELVEWRNPQGNEQGWYGKELPKEEGFIGTAACLLAGRLLCTEIALVALMSLAAIETVAYGALALLSLTLYPLTDRPFTFFVELLESSSFTVIWTTTYLFSNCGENNLFTNESFVRMWMDEDNCTPIRFFRREDREPISAWMAAADLELLEPIQFLLASEERTQEGAEFLIEEIYKKESPEFQELFLEGSCDIVMYILNKAMYLCAFGEKQRKNPIPPIFGTTTTDRIQKLRTTEYKSEVLAELEQHMSSLEQFSKELTTPGAKSLFAEISKVAGQEMKWGSALTTVYWHAAIKLLTDNPTVQGQSA